MRPRGSIPGGVAEMCTCGRLFALKNILHIIILNYINQQILTAFFRKLAEILSLTNSKESLREAAELDYYVAGY